MSDLNAIGEFPIGIGAIGDAPFNWEQTILSQYANSDIILTYLELLAQNLDANENIDNFYDVFWNIQTAVGWGLDFWGQIVGIPNGRILSVQSTPYFGFNEANDPNEFGWNQAPFYSGQALTANVSLSDSAFRQLIYAKAAANITNCSIMAINAILQILFGSSGICYVQDGLNMTMQYFFQFVPTPVQLSIIVTSGVLPKPSGVSVSVIQA